MSVDSMNLFDYATRLLNFVSLHAKKISDRSTVDLFVEFPSKRDLEERFEKEWDLEFNLKKNDDVNGDIKAFARALTSGDGFPKEFCRMGKKITDFVKETKSLSFDNCGNLEEEKKEWKDVRHALETGASLKKRHEVVKMAPVVNMLAKRCKAETVFDIGSGQGHL